MAKSDSFEGEEAFIAQLMNPASRSAAYETLLNLYQQRIYWLIRKMVLDHDDANDLCQDVFVKVWLNIEKFRKDAKLFTWIYRIAANESINFLNSKKRMLLVGYDAETSDYLLPTLNNAAFFDADTTLLNFQKAILTLPDKQRLVFNLKYFDELKYEEISEITGTSVGALKASFHIASKKIEEILIQI